MPQDGDKLSWRTRAKLCWSVLTKGKYDPRDYKTIRQQEQWDICEQRRRDLEGGHRPREPFPYDDDYMEQ